MNRTVVDGAGVRAKRATGGPASWTVDTWARIFGPTLGEIARDQA